MSTPSANGTAIHPAPANGHTEEHQPDTPRRCSYAEIRRRLLMRRWLVQLFVVVVVLFLLVGRGYSYVLDHAKGFGPLVVVIILFGGGGGILYAARENMLEYPAFRPRGLRLGWVGDAMYGFAGGLAVFLVTPGLSEGAGKLFDENGQVIMKAPKDSNGIDFLTVVGSALIGGYAGRLVLKQAADRYGTQLREVRNEQDRMGERLRQARNEIDQNRADHEAWTLVVRLVNHQLDDPKDEAIAAALRRASPEARDRVFDYAVLYYKADPSRAADIARALRLLNAVDPTGLGPRALEFARQIEPVGTRRITV